MIYYIDWHVHKHTVAPHKQTVTANSNNKTPYSISRTIDKRTDTENFERWKKKRKENTQFFFKFVECKLMDFVGADESTRLG